MIFKYLVQTRKKNQVHYNFFFKESSSLQNGEADWADCYTQAQQIRSTDRTLRFTPIEATTLRGVARGGGADQLTLFKPGWANYPHILLLEPPKFFTFRHH